MFTDVVGYSRFMSENEMAALSLLEEHNMLVFPLIEQYEGKLIKSIGDALLVDFHSVKQACECALAIQKAIDVRNRDSEAAFYLRIGVHLGDIWYTDTDVFGDGVNVAARLEPLAAPGGIVVSGDVYNQIVNKLATPLRSLGKKTLKNISKKIEVYELETGYELRDERYAQTDTTSELKNKLLEFADKGLSESFLKGVNTTDEELAGITNTGDRVKVKLMKVADKFMDKAIQEWEKQPQEKKDKIIAGITAEISSELNGADKEGEGGGEIAFGISASVGFGAAWFFTANWWWLLPFSLLGLAPLLSGISKVIRGHRKGVSRNPEMDKNTREKTVLAFAKSNLGRVTVLQLAGSTDLSIDEAKDTLDSLVANDYAQLHIEENGSLLYEFPDFLEKRLKDTSAEQSSS